jgi:abortive infection bacteriophage resistance protein
MLSVKEPTTYKQQIELLRQRGCDVLDEGFCVKMMSQMNYYRLSAYFLPFKGCDENYKPGTNFEQICQIYEFDRKLRGILFSVIEEVEVNLRAKLAYFHAHKYGADGYMNPMNYRPKHNHEKFIKEFRREVNNNSKSLFVQHHNEKYGGQFPIWVAIELFTLGMLSYFFVDLKGIDRRQIANDLLGEDEKDVSSWLRCCTDLRNICAHYGRLYYRIFSAMPLNIHSPKSSEDEYLQRRLFPSVLALRKLHPDPLTWNSSFVEPLSALILQYGDSINLVHIGFPDDWEILLHKGSSPL